MASESRSNTQDDGAPDGDDRIDEMVEESFPASDPPTGWAGEDPRDRPRTQDIDSSSSPSDRMSSRLAE